MSVCLGDAMVQKVQEWYNLVYKNKYGYVEIVEDGIAGYSTCSALITALQIELGISSPNGVFGPSTIENFSKVGINENTNNENMIRILQGGFYCKGIECDGFDGVFGGQLMLAILKFKEYTGIDDGVAQMDAKHMKALLNTDAFVKASDGKSYIVDAQRYLNKYYSNYYWAKIGLIPCNGITDRNMAKAIVYAIQCEESVNGEGIDGLVGTNTLNKAPVLSEGSTKTKFVKLLQIAISSMYLVDVDFDGVFDSKVKEAVIDFQKFMCLDQDSSVVLGTVDRKTWAALIISKGDVTRTADACDCSTKLTLEKAQALKNSGYNCVGRYLTGTVNGIDKSLSIDEIEDITKAGMLIFAIYQNGGASSTYFNFLKGIADASSAVKAARSLHIPLGQIIYFAVDYDFTEKQAKEVVSLYFQGINTYFSQYNHRYGIGIYGSRNTCAIISDENLACSSFVSDMSTGYSGNMGYRLPENWAFDQFYEYKFSYLPGATFDLDRNVASKRNTVKNVASSLYTDFDANTKCGHDECKNVTLHDMELQDDGKYKCSVCGYEVMSPMLQDSSILTIEERLMIRTLYIFYVYYCYLNKENILYSDYNLTTTLLAATQRIRLFYQNQYEYSDGYGICMLDKFNYPIDQSANTKIYMPKCVTKNPFEIAFYNDNIGNVKDYIFGILCPQYAAYKIGEAVRENLEDSEELTNIFIRTFLGILAEKSGIKALSIILDLLNVGISLNPDLDVNLDDYIVSFQTKSGPGTKSKDYSYIVYSPLYEIKKIIFNDYSSLSL